MFKIDIYHNWHFERKNTDSELGLSKTLTNVNVVDRHLHECEFVWVFACIVIFGCKNYFFFWFWINNFADIEKKHVSWFVMLKVALLNNWFSSCELELEQFKTKIFIHFLHSCKSACIVFLFTYFLWLCWVTSVDFCMFCVKVIGMF